MTINDGGSAFPCGFHPEGNSADQNGMTLRDYFAAKAMQALIGNDRDTVRCVMESYAVADVMLKERDNG